MGELNLLVVEGNKMVQESTGWASVILETTGGAEHRGGEESLSSQGTETHSVQSRGNPLRVGAAESEKVGVGWA